MVFASGDLIVVYVSVGLGQTVSSITDSGSPVSAYSERVSAVNGNTTTYLYTATAASSTNNTITVTISAAGANAIGAIEYSGVVGFGASHTSTGSSTSPSVSLTTQNSNSWVVVGFGWTGSGSHSADTGFVDRHANNPHNQGLDYGDTNAAKPVGTYTYSSTLSLSMPWAMLALELTNSSSTPGIYQSFDGSWFINNCAGALAGQTGTEAIVNGTLQLREQSPNLGDNNNYAYCTAQRGTFPWGSSAGTPIAPNSTSVSSTVDFLKASLTSSTRYHLLIALYYRLPAGTSCPSGGTGADGYCWLDTQSRVVWVNGAFEAIGTAETYTAQALGYGLATTIIAPGQSGTITANVTSQCQKDLAAWGLPTNTKCTLEGIEIGTEGFQFSELDTNWTGVSIVDSLSNNPASSDWTILSGTWTQKNGVIDSTGSWPEMRSTSTFASNRTVTVRAITITAGSNVWNTAWIGGKYVNANNSIILILHTDGILELQFKQNGVQTSYNTASSTGLSPSAWHTFKMVFSGNTVYAYVDGTLYLTVTNSLVGTLGAAYIMLESGGAPESQFDSATITCSGK
jgi:hypothetical protein